MGEDTMDRLWARLDDLERLITRLLTIQEEREKTCTRHEECLKVLKVRVHQLEISKAKIVAVATAAGTVMSLFLNHLLKALGTAGQ